MGVLYCKEALIREHVILYFDVHVDTLQLTYFSDIRTTVLPFNSCICVVLDITRVMLLSMTLKTIYNARLY